MTSKLTDTLDSAKITDNGVISVTGEVWEIGKIRLAFQNESSSWQIVMPISDAEKVHRLLGDLIVTAPSGGR